MTDTTSRLNILNDILRAERERQDMIDQMITLASSLFEGCDKAAFRVQLAERFPPSPLYREAENEIKKMISTH